MREDPDVEVMNISVGNAKVVHLLHGFPDDLAANFLGHLVMTPMERSSRRCPRVRWTELSVSSPRSS